MNFDKVKEEMEIFIASTQKRPDTVVLPAFMKSEIYPPHLIDSKGIEFRVYGMDILWSYSPDYSIVVLKLNP